MKALIVDGYNAINKIPHLEKLMDKSLHEARRAITELARAYKRRSGGIAKLYVVFDGKDEYRNQHHITPTEQVFSKSGKGDSEIIRLVRDLSQKYHVIVASDDNFVRNNARAYNATVIKISQFFTSIRKKDSRKKGVSLTKKISPESALEINKELKKHWNL